MLEHFERGDYRNTRVQLPTDFTNHKGIHFCAMGLQKLGPLTCDCVNPTMDFQYWVSINTSRELNYQDKEEIFL